MWTLIIMLHAVNPNVPSSKGSISFPTPNYQECQKISDTIKASWTSDKYRVSANCIHIKQ